MKVIDLFQSIIHNNIAELINLTNPDQLLPSNDRTSKSDNQQFPSVPIYSNRLHLQPSMQHMFNSVNQFN